MPRVKQYPAGGRPRRKNFQGTRNAEKRIGWAAGRSRHALPPTFRISVNHVQEEKKKLKARFHRAAFDCTLIRPIPAVENNSQLHSVCGAHTARPHPRRLFSPTPIKKSTNYLRLGARGGVEVQRCIPLQRKPDKKSDEKLQAIL